MLGSSKSKSKSVGIVGLGIIGSRVAECLRKAGHDVFVWNRSSKPIPNFMASPSEIAEVASVIQIFVRDAEALLEVLESMKGSLKKHHVVLCHSTVSVRAMKKAAAIVAPTGAGFLDAPFTGSLKAAEMGDLVYYIGGEKAELEKARKTLEITSKSILHLGQPGDATVLKIATNLISAAVVEALAEAIAITKAEGVDTAKLQEALAANANGSPLIQMKLPTMTSRSYPAHFSLKNMLKDARYAQAIADERGFSLPVLNATAQVMDRGVQGGKGELDYAVVMENFSQVFRLSEMVGENPVESEAKAEPLVKPLQETPLTLPDKPADSAPVLAPKKEEPVIPAEPSKPAEEPAKDAKEKAGTTTDEKIPQKVEAPAPTLEKATAEEAQKPEPVAEKPLSEPALQPGEPAVAPTPATGTLSDPAAKPSATVAAPAVDLPGSAAPDPASLPAPKESDQVQIKAIAAAPSAATLNGNNGPAKEPVAPPQKAAATPPLAAAPEKPKSKLKSLFGGLLSRKEPKEQVQKPMLISQKLSEAPARPAAPPVSPAAVTPPAKPSLTQALPGLKDGQTRPVPRAPLPPKSPETPAAVEDELNTLGLPKPPVPKPLKEIRIAPAPLTRPSLVRGGSKATLVGIINSSNTGPASRAHTQILVNDEKPSGTTTPTATQPEALKAKEGENPPAEFVSITEAESSSTAGTFMAEPVTTEPAASSEPDNLTGPDPAPLEGAEPAQQTEVSASLDPEPEAPVLDVPMENQVPETQEAPATSLDQAEVPTDEVPASPLLAEEAIAAEPASPPSPVATEKAGTEEVSPSDEPIADQGAVTDDTVTSKSTREEVTQQETPVQEEENLVEPTEATPRDEASEMAAPEPVAVTPPAPVLPPVMAAPPVPKPAVPPTFAKPRPSPTLPPPAPIEPKEPARTPPREISMPAIKTAASMVQASLSEMERASSPPPAREPVVEKRASGSRELTAARKILQEIMDLERSTKRFMSSPTPAASRVEAPSQPATASPPVRPMTSAPPPARYSSITAPEPEAAPAPPVSVYEETSGRKSESPLESIRNPVIRIPGAKPVMRIRLKAAPLEEENSIQGDNS